MLLCNGKQCIWRKVCSRYVIGRAASQLKTGDGDWWIDRCLHALKFHRMNGTPDSECPPLQTINSIHL